jgi:hypothetical protein
MAKLTDKQKAAAILGENVEPETAVETPTEPEAPIEPETTPEAAEPAEPESEEEKPTEEEAEPEEPVSSFTKQFPNLKGETLDEYTPELEKAYDNSFKESLRLVEENKQLRAQLAQAPQVPTPNSEPNPQAPVAPPNPLSNAIDDHPAIQYAKPIEQRDMFSAFDKFKVQYPQVTENFDTFTKASDGVKAALEVTLGRAPTFDELFDGIAGTLHWQPATTTAKKDAAIKAAGSLQSTASTTPAPPKQSKVPEKSVELYQKMFTSKTREEAIKELSEVV